MGLLDYLFDGRGASRIAPLELPNSAAPFGVLTPQEQAQIPPGLPEAWIAATIDNLANVIATPGRIMRSTVPIAIEDMIGPALETALLLSGPKPPPFAVRRPLGLPPLLPGSHVSHIGPNGPVVEGLQGRAAEATGWLRQAETGDVRGVLTHPEMPGRSVDLIYGTDKFGLRHIDKKRPGFADQLADRWDGMKLESDSAYRTILNSEDARAVVPKDFRGEPKDWLLTFYDPKTRELKDQPGGKSIGGAADFGPTSSDRLTNPNLGPSLPAAKPSQWMPFGWLPALSLEQRRQQDGKVLQ